MSSRAFTRNVLIVAAATLVGLVVVNLNAKPDVPEHPTQPKARCGGCGGPATAPAQCSLPTTRPAGGRRCAGTKQAMADNLNAVAKSLDAAAAAVKAGDSEIALAELAKAKDLVEGSRRLVGRCGQACKHGKIVNTRCPIMGSKIDPANVPANLTRAFGGGKVGFCCPGCPAMWDKLTDEQKTAKLQAAAGK